jgi:hypothetical protein
MGTIVDTAPASTGLGTAIAIATALPHTHSWQQRARKKSHRDLLPPGSSRIRFGGEHTPTARSTSNFAITGNERDAAR